MAQRPGGRAAEGDGRARGERHDGQGLALLREDAGFHAYQMLEAGIRQITAWGDTDEGRRILVAVARYLRLIHRPNARRCRPPTSFKRGGKALNPTAANLPHGDVRLRAVISAPPSC